MKQEILSILLCPNCRANSLSVKEGISDQIEVRTGKIACGSCRSEYKIEGGIIDFLRNPNEGVLRERRAMDEDDYITDETGNKYRITNQTIEKFKDKFLVFPEGDGSYFFKPGGSFQSTAEASGRFYSAMDGLNLRKGERVLEIGACFSYASFKFAQKGCSVAALDISNYLKVSDLYVKQAYFERLFSDMHRMPFMDNSFDVVFGSAVLHHSKNLKDVFAEIRRVLRPEGRLVLINEAAKGVLEKVHPVYKKMEEKGFGDTAYNILEWIRGARLGGFRRVKAVFTSLADDYIMKYKNRGAKFTFKVRLAYFFMKHRRIENFIMFFLILPRLLFRPKSWKLLAIK
ncbi:MAG: methyltransferase domain-containing protein [Candidatus Omnitrophica bacterium]|nr:methyltransferase domain-containing protein [Candidatus Omnitrophota bacterium]MDD5660370.1 methyltransferase domain-containing protein [Candidatus Omnitrophota bacterium]